ncbi:MAG TPA: hypothetical protein VGQ25_08525 [Gemmatimonadales bacterium]|jgi:hypothetical protein|nr:hypothetical protein [Gemmatimonadales bacterium]
MGEIAQKVSQSICRDLIVSNPKHAKPMGFEPGGAGDVVRGAVRVAVNPTVEFEY